MDINDINKLTPEQVKEANAVLAKRVVTKYIVMPLAIAGTVLLAGALLNKLADDSAAN